MKVALITGAASGLGWALSQHMVAAGYRVVMTDVQRDLLEARAKQLSARAPQAVRWQELDVTDAASREHALQALHEREGRLDVLINNAGITHRSLAAKTDMAVFEKVMAVDWQAPVALALACLPLLKQHRGSIVNIGSMAGWMPVLGRAGYCSAKAALGQFFEVLRGEVAAQGVHILMVYPSFLDTPIDANALGHDGAPASHARSSTGKVRSASWMAEKIIEALACRRARLFPDRYTAWVSVLWRVAPSLYQRLMVRKFASELEQ